MNIGDVVMYKPHGCMGGDGYAGRLGIIELMRKTTHHTTRHIPEALEGCFWLRIRWLYPWKRVHPTTGKEILIEWSDLGSWDFYVV